MAEGDSTPTRGGEEKKTRRASGRSQSHKETETITGARELCSCRKSGTRTFSQSCSVCILEPNCCLYVPPSSKEIPPFYISELPTRHGHSPIGEVARGAEGAASRENSILFDKLGMHNPRSMDIGHSAGLQDTIHQHAASGLPAKRETLLTRRGDPLGRRDSGDVVQTSHRGMPLPGAGFSLVGISNTKKKTAVRDQ